jgi:hypothetical protein
MYGKIILSASIENTGQPCHDTKKSLSFFVPAKWAVIIKVLFFTPSNARQKKSADAGNFFWVWCQKPFYNVAAERSKLK